MGNKESFGPVFFGGACVLTVNGPVSSSVVVESRRLNPLEDPDFTLIVRVEDMGGESVNALNGNARVKIVVQENLWVNPGPINLREQLKGIYPMPIGKVQQGWKSHSHNHYRCPSTKETV